jgi:hypothetical protein
MNSVEIHIFISWKFVHPQGSSCGAGLENRYPEVASLPAFI